MSAPRPDEVTDGVALWDVDPVEVSADPSSGLGPGSVALDGRSLSPAAARRLAAVLAAAADHAEGKS